MKRLLIVAGFAALVVPVAEAYAQMVGTFRVRAGLGAQVQPEYLGSGKTEWAPYPTLSFTRGDRPFGFGAPDDSLSISLLSSDGFSAGPALSLRGGRKESDAGLPIGKVGSTIEAGGFVQHQASESLRLRAELRKGIGGHGGLVGHVGADQVWRDGDRYLFSIGPRLRFSDGKFQRAFFGVGPEESLASGLPQYRPGGGIHAIGLASGMHYSLGGRWGLFGYARYDRLIGDARKSPIIREIGSPNQFSAGVGVSHTFTLKL